MVKLSPENELSFDKKLDELIALLAQNDFDKETVRKFQKKFNKAIELNKGNPKMIKAFKVAGANDNASRDELLDEFSALLINNKIDSRISSRYLKALRTSRLFLMIVGIIMIALGFAMIIMPAPPYFEMFTIFYFNHDDGVTLMDLISLAIIFSGIFIFVRSIYKKPV
jgi:hypothetical protein